MLKIGQNWGKIAMLNAQQRFAPLSATIHVVLRCQIRFSLGHCDFVI